MSRVAGLASRSVGEVWSRNQCEVRGLRRGGEGQGRALEDTVRPLLREKWGATEGLKAGDLI